MEDINIYTISAVSVLDVFFIGCACAFCPCFKKRFKILYFSILLSLINFLMFTSGSFIYLSGYKESFVKSSSIGNYFVLFIVLKFLYDSFFKGSKKNNTIKLSFLLLLVSGFDCFLAGVVSPVKNFLIPAGLIIFLSFGFTISGFYGSRLFIVAKQIFAQKLI
jgi:hypothetical protein